MTSASGPVLSHTSVPSFQRSQEVERYPFIDALRGWAFLAVLAVHVSPRVSTPHWLSVASLCGNYGVQLFFVISALTLFMSLHVRSSRDRHLTAAFLVRRGARIAPLFWLAAAFYVWHDGVGPRDFAPEGLGVGHILSTLLFMHGWYPSTINSVVPGGWSIAVEMNFYLLVPLCFRLINSLRRSIVVSLVVLPMSIVVSVVSRMLLKAHFPPSFQELIGGFTYYWLPRQLPVFLLGFVLYFLILRARSATPASSPHLRRGALLVPAALALIIVSMIWNARLPIAYFWFSCEFALLALGLSRAPFWVLVNPASRYVGKVSFSAYLVHFLVLDLISQPLNRACESLGIAHAGALPYTVLYVCGVLLTVLIASATYQAVELPGQRFGKVLIHRFDLGPEERLSGS
jgi:peptidoglycan/LPS O-acetylase OafA/YrhL